MSEHHDHDINVPRGALIAAATLISITIAAVAIFRLFDLDPAAQIPDPDKSVMIKQLRFEDSPEGTVLIYEVSENQPDRIVHVVQPGEGGFIRGVLRSFARARRASNIGREYPFLLKLQANGTVLLEDPQTEQMIDLQAFGPTNIESFRILFQEQGSES
jgi:putative photosynthetic complex assembly protein